MGKPKKRANPGNFYNNIDNYQDYSRQLPENVSSSSSPPPLPNGLPPPPLPNGLPPPPHHQQYQNQQQQPPRWGQTPPPPSTIQSHGSQTVKLEHSYKKDSNEQKQQQYSDLASIKQENDYQKYKQTKKEEPEEDLGYIEIDEVEWANDEENNNLSGELAERPKFDRRNVDPCGCQAPPPIYDKEGNILPYPPDTPKCCTDLSCVLFACAEECYKNCEAGTLCANKRLTNKEWKQVKIINADKKGRGLIVCEDVKKGDLITEYVGRAVRRHYLDVLFRRYRNERMLYIMSLDADTYLDAREKGGKARFINHSCDPNCKVERWKVKGVFRAGVFALRDIPANTELSFDYKWERKRGRAPTKCHCLSDNCRGTLELPKSIEDEVLENKLRGHWKKPLINRAGREIINRSIKILSKEHSEYFVADVCKYDESKKQHLVIYSHDLIEAWEDLSKEDWLLLDEEAEQFVIAKKKRTIQKTASLVPSSSSTSLTGNMPGSGSASPIPPNLIEHRPSMTAEEEEKLRTMKNYFFVQTPVKDIIVSKHLLDRIQRSCQVTCKITRCSGSRADLAVDSSNNNDNKTEEIKEEQKELESSNDGCVWKIAISGINLLKAYTILERTIAFHKNKMIKAEEESLGIGITDKGIKSELILPRCIVDTIKRKLPFIVRDKINKNNNAGIGMGASDGSPAVDLHFQASESKSKQFAKLLIVAKTIEDSQMARDILWKELVSTCTGLNAPLTLLPGVPKDLGILGGELSDDRQFQLLFKNNSTTTTMLSNIDGGSGNNSNLISSNSSLKKQQICSENLSDSAFFTSFQKTQRCSIWIQNQNDKGRIDADNRVVNEGDPNKPRKVYFGCEYPNDVPKLWGLIETRISELERGVKYLHLGSDKMYQQVMMQSGSRFFDYVKRLTGASVTVDSMTGNHLRIDGGVAQQHHNNNGATNYSESAALAEELIRLQIELYRDHCIRQQNWVFGRDWTLSAEATSAVASTVSVSATDSAGLGSSISRPVSVPATRLNPFDPKSVANACMEIAEITSHIDMEPIVAAHTAIIMYRFLNKVQGEASETPKTQLKIREILLACIFLASKAQKETKWKRLEVLLQAAYQTFYPGSKFDKDGEEAAIWEKRVISAELEILLTLEYDVFWKGADWILTAVTDAGRIAEPLAKNALEFAFSGPVIGAGQTLWLKYGPEYVFAAAAGFLSVDLEHVFSALSLIPLKVSQAAEIIANSLKTNSFTKRSSTKELFNGGKMSLLNQVPHIREVCIKKMMMQNTQNSDDAGEISQRFQIIGYRDCKRRVFRAVDPTTLKNIIMPLLDGVCAESKCSIFVGENATDHTTELVLEGSWRALAIAEHLLMAEGASALRSAIDTSTNFDPLSKMQAKLHPGLVNMNTISTADGWDGTIQSATSANAPADKKKAGGKCCIAGKIDENSLQQVGLRWWIPPRYGPSLTGSVCDTFLTRDTYSAGGRDHLDALAQLTKAFMGEQLSMKKFPLLCSKAKSISLVDDTKNKRSVAVSIQRWPAEKVASREQAKTGKAGMQIGFSPAAIQEMQLLTQLHCLIPSPKGHPNFILPVAVALPSEAEDEKLSESEVKGTESTAAGRDRDDDIFSLFRSSEENEKRAEKERKRKDLASGPHLVFNPTPFVLQKIISRSKKRRGSEEQTISSALLSAWFHDLLSALVHCHTNNVILRTLQPDQIVIDHSGVAKLAGLYRATVLPMNERGESINPLESASKTRKEKTEEEDVSNNPYVAPEIMLGSKKHTKETDIWAVGSLLAHLLLNKPLFMGKDRKSLLLSTFKIVGTPSKDNYRDASKFPNYREPPKRYKRGVEKALQYMMKESEYNKHSGAISLLSRMLHLDPTKRITAVEALGHYYMTGYIENSNDDSFRQQYVDDWILLKDKIVRSSKADEDEAERQELLQKRKANFLMATSALSDDEDDLYAMDDLLGGDNSISKKSKLS